MLENHVVCKSACAAESPYTPKNCSAKACPDAACLGGYIDVEGVSDCDADCQWQDCKSIGVKDACAEAFHYSVCELQLEQDHEVEDNQAADGDESGLHYIEH